MTIHVHRIPAFTDNYLWLLHDDEGGETAVVDPGDAAPVEAMLAKLDLSLSAIVITHHHPDHIGGVDDLLRNRNIPVHGPVSDNIPQVTVPLREGDSVRLAGAAFQVFEVPGHTLDHIAYYSPRLDRHPALFCGDTLFAGGCGRLFEGTPEQMVASLEKLATLPGDTRIYCAHEYTQANLRFAGAVEPNNRDLVRRIGEVAEMRSENRPTVPSRLEEERRTNPFLRCGTDSVARAAADHSGRTPGRETETFAIIRRWKDNF